MTRYTGYLIVIDTNCINARQNDPFLNELEKLADEGGIDIETTQTLLNELEKSKGYPKGKKKADKYIFSIGPEDDNGLDEILKMLFGLNVSYSESEMSDARQILTAIMYGAKFFVTRDRVLLSGSDKFKNKFEITITSPEDCLLAVKNRLSAIANT